jgi:hypothetical protein
MDAISNEWGLPIAALALLSVIAIFGLAYRFIRSATESNKRFRWLQIVGRRERQRRSGGFDRR